MGVLATRIHATDPRVPLSRCFTAKLQLRVDLALDNIINALLIPTGIPADVDPTAGWLSPPDFIFVPCTDKITASASYTKQLDLSQ